MPVLASAPLPDTSPRPRGVTMLAALNGVSAAIYLGLGVLMLFFGAMPPNVTEPWVAMVAGGFLAAAGLFHVVNATLLWRLRPFGRILQIVQSAVWVWFIPVGTIVSAFVLYYLTRPGVRLLFSGEPWSTLTPEMRRLVERDRDLPAMTIVLAIAVVGAGLFFVGLLASLAVPVLTGLRQR